MAGNIEELRFLTPELTSRIATEFGTPVYVYDQRTLEAQADLASNFPNEYGLTVRYAMKASPNANILRLFHNNGIQIDASSGWEAWRAIAANIPPENILLTPQEMPEEGDLMILVRRGVNFNACSKHQLKVYGSIFEGSDVTVRVNPGVGSGGNNRTNVGGPGSSFGIWHKYLEDMLAVAERYGLGINRVHTHIGSGSDPEVWKNAASLSLDAVRQIVSAGHHVDTLNLGGGYKVGRMSYEQSTDLQQCGEPVRAAFKRFYDETGVKLRLEIEPGTFLVANAGAVIAEVTDVVDTGSEGHTFVKVDTGMTEIARTCLYGAQHPITVVPQNGERRGLRNYLVVGHCCESGDSLTPEPGNPEGLKPRLMRRAKIGDLVVIGGAGAYCAGMSTINYNSFPQAPEVLIDRKGEPHLIRKRQDLEQMLVNEIMTVRIGAN
ncbi:diaminopimelate decarboxylase [Candidatus Woesearchaeota archaeon]|nr:diaminopimelate decarboxylase [Candidatus Woesearchaeota archaeon]